MKKTFLSGVVLALLFMVLGSGLSGLSATAQTDARTQAGSSGLSALVARQQLRMDTLETSLKELRGTVEVELRDIRMRLNSLLPALAGQSETSVDVKQFQSEMARLSDAIEILNQRISRTLELTSDVEFRILRLEKRMQTLMSLSGDGLSEQLAQQDVTAAQKPPAVSIGRDADTGETVWKIEEDKLSAQLEADKQVEPNNAAENSQAKRAEIPEQTSAVADESLFEPATTAEIEDSVSAVPQSLSICRCQPRRTISVRSGPCAQNDLKTAENAFIEFAKLNPSMKGLWMRCLAGRVQFIKVSLKKQQQSSKFNSLILLIRGLLIPLCGLLNLLRSLPIQNKPVHL